MPGIDPGRAGLPALPVDPEPGLAVVEAADDQVDVGEEPEPKIGDHVAVQGMIVISGLSSRARRAATWALGLAAVLLAEQHRPRQVRGFDHVEIDQVRRAQPQQSQVLHDFVAQGTRADDQNPGRPAAVPAATMRSSASGCNGRGRRSRASRMRALRVLRLAPHRPVTDGRESSGVARPSSRLLVADCSNLSITGDRGPLAIREKSTTRGQPCSGYSRLSVDEHDLIVVERGVSCGRSSGLASRIIMSFGSPSKHASLAADGAVDGVSRSTLETIRSETVSTAQAPARRPPAPDRKNVLRAEVRVTRRDTCVP